MSHPPSGPSGWGYPGPRQQQGPPQQQQPVSWGPPPGYGPPQWQPSNPSGPWGTPPPQPPKKNHTGVILGVIAASVAVVVGVVIALAVVTGGSRAGDESVASSDTTSSAEKSSGASTQEDEVQAAAERRVALINSQDAAGLHRMACEADSRTESTSGYQALFDENGSISASIDVRDVAVTGLIGTVEGVMSIDEDRGDVNWSFKKEDGQWRFCPSLAASSSSGPSSTDDDIITG